MKSSSYFSQVFGIFKNVHKKTSLFASKFQFAKAPLSSISSCLGVVAFYLVGLFLLQRFMQNKSPIRLNGLFILHNALLTIASLVLLVLICYVVVPIVLKRGLFYGICHKSMVADNYLNFLYYINYWMKVWELLDTVFLVLRKKKLEFLHVYHHSLTMVLCYTQLTGKTSVQWIPITVNLFVHVFMYYYYARAAAGVRLWWKKYLTTLQIAQFVIDLGFIYYCMYLVLFTHGKCQGDVVAGYFATFLITSYLFLFIKFFLDTYSARKEVETKKTD